MKLTKGEINLIAKYGLAKYGDPFDPDKVEKRQNRFSGEIVPLNRFANKLCTEVLRAYSNYEVGVKGAAREFDRLKYLLLKIDPNAYMKLID